MLTNVKINRQQSSNEDTRSGNSGGFSDFPLCCENPALASGSWVKMWPVTTAELEYQLRGKNFAFVLLPAVISDQGQKPAKDIKKKSRLQA